MKIALIISLSIGGLLILAQIYMAYLSNKSLSQPYRLIKRLNDIEIRFYPSATLASITANDKTYNKLGSNGFRRLANYIFGSNKRNEKIAMTSPVYMQINDESSRMSFVLPSGLNATNSPLPNDSSIHFETTTNHYVATIEFSGYISEKNIFVNANKLKDYLLAEGIEFDEKYNVLGYNPPFQLINRRNEIMFQIEYQEKTSSN